MSAFAQAQKVADAVLYEGYLLFPYRASALKNQFRWQFGVVVPPGFDSEEPSAAQTEVLARGQEPRFQVRVRFMQLQVRPDDGWEEGVERVFDFDPAAPGAYPLELPGGDGLCPLSAVLEVSWEQLQPDLRRLRLRVQNLTPGRFGAEERRLAVRHSLVGLHTLAAVEDGHFLSLAEPPPDAAEAAAGCRNLHTWPALVGSQVVLSSPIILGDQPQVAAQSPGDMFDATEIDELLTLCTSILTDEEKDEARRTDRRARAIVDRCDNLSQERLSLLHAAMVPIEKGSRVRLRPKRQADAQDMFLAGRTARVCGIHQDLDGAVHLSVSLDDDPAADLLESYGRYYYFHPEEVEPL